MPITPRLVNVPRLVALALAGTALAAHLGLAATLPRPVGAPRPVEAGHEVSDGYRFQDAVGATVKAPAEVGVQAFDGARTLLEILGSDVAAFFRFFTTRMTFSTRLGDNAFFVAHREALIVGPKADRSWDLAWAVPDELKNPAAWRAAVSSLPPASLRGTRATPEHGVNFVGWPAVVAE